jgi:very-short-patch-repair endonuclease
MVPIMSVSERVFWGRIRKDQLGYRFRRQVSIAGYYIDFYCAAAQLGIEIDGEQHLLSGERDTRRDGILAANGIEIIRIPSLGLFETSSAKEAAWIDLIKRRCAERIAEFDSLRRSLRSS